MLIQIISVSKGNMHNGTSKVASKPAYYGHAIREWVDEHPFYTGWGGRNQWETQSPDHNYL
jgi:hypothetical protein